MAWNYSFTKEQKVPILNIPSSIQIGRSSKFQWESEKKINRQTEDRVKQKIKGSKMLLAYNVVEDVEVAWHASAQGSQLPCWAILQHIQTPMQCQTCTKDFI